jgi:hypothetical protein
VILYFTINELTVKELHVSTQRNDAFSYIYI